MTLQQYLSLTPDQQGLEAAKCFTPKPWKHGFKNCIAWTVCSKCKLQAEDTKNYCPVPEPLTLDWNTAKRLQGECGDVLFAIAIDEMYYLIKGDCVSAVPQLWLIYDALPIHYIAACMAAKGYFKETK